MSDYKKQIQEKNAEASQKARERLKKEIELRKYLRDKNAIELQDRKDMRDLLNIEYDVDDYDIDDSNQRKYNEMTGLPDQMTKKEAEDYSKLYQEELHDEMVKRGEYPELRADNTPRKSDFSADQVLKERDDFFKKADSVINKTDRIQNPIVKEALEQRMAKKAAEIGAKKAGKLGLLPLLTGGAGLLYSGLSEASDAPEAGSSQSSLSRKLESGNRLSPEEYEKLGTEEDVDTEDLEKRAKKEAMLRYFSNKMSR
jgi:hypothetical protein